MIVLKNASKTYRMGKVDVHALVDVTLTIACGEFIAIMGPSGSGKSTLMHVLGLLDKPERGSYEFMDREMTKLNEAETAEIRNRLIGFVFQQFHLLARMNALDNAALPLLYAGKSRSKDCARKKIEEVDLSDRLHHRPNELSGGQQQRIAIARALVNEPLIIFADEPTGNLDSKSKEEIISILKDLNNKGTTVVVVTHEQEVALHARRIIRMHDGKIISDETVKNNSEKKVMHDKCTPAIVDDTLAQSYKIVGFKKSFDYLRQALFAMLTHKMRSILSILGIFIGVAAVITMLALGSGAQEALEKQLSTLGSNLLIVMGGSSKLHHVQQGAGSVTRFTFQDVEAIGKLNDLVARVNPSVMGRGQLVYGNKNWNTQVEGAGADFAHMRAAVPTIGRFFSVHDVKMRNKVAVIGTTVARELFGEMNPVGETIKINLINFKVIGVLPSKGASTFRDQDDTLVIPITTAMYRLLGKDYIDMIYVEVKDPQLMDEAQEAVSKTIIKQHRLNKDGEDTFSIRNLADIKATLEATTKTMSLLLGSIAAISLLVGGIGIMNIMLVSVSERTREIGLRKAIGARNKDIMAQFVIEAMLLSSIGGFLGIAFGAGLAFLITTIAGWVVNVSMFSIVLAGGFSVTVGLIFGLWPAYQASRLNPIDALRYE